MASSHTDAASLCSLPRSLHASFAHLVQRLEYLACPLAPQVAAPAEGGGIDMFAPGVGSLALETLQSRDDAAVHASSAAPPLLLRLALVQWLLARYDPDLPRAFTDLAADYAHQQASQATLGQFKRVLRICVFLGLIPATGSAASATQGLALLVGAAPPSAELGLLHALVDLVCALPSDAFFASPAQYSSVQSYQVHNDTEFHKHVRLLQCVSNSAVAPQGFLDPATGVSAAQAVDSALSDRMDLFPATLMMTAHALQKVKEKQGQSKKATTMPDPLALTLHMERLQEDMKVKALVLDDLKRNIPLTASEDYLPSLSQLEQRLQTLTQLVSQFESEYPSRFQPLVEAVLAHPVRVSPIGPALLQVQRDKRDMQRLLQACMHTQRNYAHILNKDIKKQMETLLQSKPDDRTTLRLTETRKVFEQSVARLEKQMATYRDAAAATAAEASAGADVSATPFPHSSPRGSRSAASTTVPLHVGYTPAASAAPAAARSSLHSSSSHPYSHSHAHSQSHAHSRSILTSSVDLLSPGAREREGSGSAGMFSPVKASPLPARLTAAAAAAEDERDRHQRAESEQRADLHLQSHQSRTPRQESVFGEAQRHQFSATPGAALAASFQRSFNSAAATAAAPAYNYPASTAHPSATHASLQHMSQRHTPSRYAPQDYHDPPATSSSPLLSRASQQHLHALALSHPQSRQDQAPLTTEQLR